ncbi:MAG: 23S rRNA (uracil(1939)-C(5))-methyltransferase RlmD [Pseudomonadota bacterium]|nr:23S rRNA (uracil(1939)-C(5))-methyltransferase RlmD [Pseudomonadota bacterium]
MSRRQRRNRLPPDPVVVQVSGLSHEGLGIAAVEGKKVFIHGALPGETVRYITTGRRRDFDQGDVVEVLEPSPDRVEPRCEFFGRCGGCCLQHLSPQAQLREKQQHLLEGLKRLGQVEPDEVYEPLLGPHWNYRRKARLAVKQVHGKGRVLIGFRERRSPYVADMTQCEVLDARVASLLQPLSALVGGSSIPDRIPQIEVAAGDEHVALVFRVLTEPTEDDRSAFQAFGRDHNVQIYLQPGRPDALVPLEPDYPPLCYELPSSDVTIGFSPTDFTQVNAQINRQMVARALALLDCSTDSRVLELFSGLGNFTLPIARRAGHVVAVEGDKALVAKGQENAARNGIENVEFHYADLYDSAQLQNPVWMNGGFDAVLLDPPRSGAREVLPLVTQSGAARVVYVSCHPATLARDAQILVHELGYRLAGTGVMDMFPQTHHVEAIACFERH